MKLIVVECEWDLGLNGSEFNHGNLGIYKSMEEAISEVKDIYETLFDGDEDNETFEAVVEDGLISFTEIDI